jgi:hypothetical protein
LGSRAGVIGFSGVTLGADIDRYIVCSGRAASPALHKNMSTSKYVISERIYAPEQLLNMCRVGLAHCVVSNCDAVGPLVQ